MIVLAGIDRFAREFFTRIPAGASVWTIALIILLSAFFPGLLRAQTSSVASVATVLTTEGTVEFLPVGTTEWQMAKIGQTLEVGDQVRTAVNSRATVRLSNLSILRVSEQMSYEILPPRDAAGKPIIDVKAGKAYFFSRNKPEEIQFETPVVTGAIRGTEFNVNVATNGRTEVALIDGAVELTNTAGDVYLSSGEEAVTEPGHAPVKTAVINAANIIQWNLYYPAVLDLSELRLTTAEQDALSNSLAAYRVGSLTEALNQYPTARDNISDPEKIYLAELLLSVGLVEKSEVQLDATSKADTNTVRLAGAIRQLINAVKLAPVANPQAELASEWLAESYVQQSRSQLPAALAASRMAVEKSPSFGFGWERLAELEFSFGHTGEALAALQRGLELAPRNAQGLALKGFLLAAKNRIPEAISQFDAAIGADGALGNAWLGRGLCEIHQGRPADGQADLVVAASVEPQRSVLRSYLGKAFANNGDFRRAEKELTLAQTLDPNDPTSWLYSALLKQQQNRVNEAVNDVQSSQQRNNNRSLFRSNLLLDEDQAVRSTSLAKIYQDAGMNEVSVNEASRAVEYDYASYSAHLFLADSLNALRDPTRFNLRYETAWFNELLLANLLSPVGARPLSQNISQQEYSRLFEKDGFGLDTTSQYRSDGQFNETVSQYGAEGRTSYSLDLDYQHNEGVRPNNDLSDIEWYSQIKQQISSKDAVTLFIKYENYHSGDNFQYNNSTNASRNFRYNEYQSPILVGTWHHEWEPGIHTLMLAGRLIDENNSSDSNSKQQPLDSYFVVPPPNSVGQYTYGSAAVSNIVYSGEFTIYTAELNQIIEGDKHSLIFGARYQNGQFTTHDTLTYFLPNSYPSVDSTVKEGFQRLSLYGYDSWRIFPDLLLTMGITYDWITYPDNFRFYPVTSGVAKREQLSPKVALVWTPRPEVTLRAAYSRALGGASFDESFTLEPTELAGFNQAFRSVISESVVGSLAAPKYQIAGGAVDLKFKTRTYATITAQLLTCDSDEDIGLLYFDGISPATTGTAPERLRYSEPSVSTTVNQLVGKYWAMGAQYKYIYSKLSWDYPTIVPFGGEPSLNQTETAALHQINAYLQFNHPSGFYARAESQWNHQDNSGHNPSDFDPPPSSSDFIQVNLFAGYRFWHRRGDLTFGILNVGGSDYSLNPLNVYNELPRSRVFMGKIRFNF